MTTKLIALGCGVIFGFVLAWSHVTDPAVIRRMLLLGEPDVFLLMGSAIVIAGLGVRLLRGSRALMTRESIGWTLAPPAARHVWGSAIFGAGWSVAATCPGPVAAMIGEGRFGGLFVAMGLFAGIALQGAISRKSAISPAPVDRRATACL